MADAKLSIVVASVGRPSLSKTLESVRDQTVYGDEVLISVQTDCPWGHAARNQLMSCARGDYLLFIDDDDVYAPGALDAVRRAVSAPLSTREYEYHTHVFRMEYPNGFRLWEDREIRTGNVSTQMVAVPRIVTLLSGCLWGDRYEGDFDFIEACSKRTEVHWHEDVIALIGHNVGETSDA